jgi:DNA end-binding protein Ku
VPAQKHVKAAPAELALARQVIDGLRHTTFDPSQYADEVKTRVRALITRKAKGGEIEVPASVEREPITDLMAALKASLGAAPQRGHRAKRAARVARKPAKRTRHAA